MTPRDPEAPQVAFRVLKTLEELGVAYHLGGSYASAIHGIPRQTHDVDLVVDFPQALVQRLVRDLEGEFYVDERAVARAVRDRTSVNRVHLGTGVKVDVFIKGTSEFGEMSRATCSSSPPKTRCRDLTKGPNGSEFESCWTA